MGSVFEVRRHSLRGEGGWTIRCTVSRAGRTIARNGYDLAIIGGGPAGMTAAVYAARKFLNTVLITENLGGQVLMTSEVENYMGYSYITGPELMEKFSEQVKRFGLALALGEVVTGVAEDAKGFRVFTKRGNEYIASALVIASGKRSRPRSISPRSPLRYRS